MGEKGTRFTTLSPQTAGHHEMVSLLRDQVDKADINLKNKKVLRMLEENQKKIKIAHKEGKDFTELMEMHKMLESVKMEISKILGIDILK